MSRSGYTDDCENIALWRGAVRSAATGKRGQKMFRDLAAAMDAMPDKALITDELITADGDFCALGVLGASRGISEQVRSVDPDEPEAVAKLFDIAPALAQEVVYMNDEWYMRDETPEQRWVRMRAWVQQNIRPAP